MILNKQDLLQLVGHRMRKEKRAVVIKFLEAYPDDTKMSFNEWTRRFAEYMKTTSS